MTDHSCLGILLYRNFVPGSPYYSLNNQVDMHHISRPWQVGAASSSAWHTPYGISLFLFKFDNGSSLSLTWVDNRYE